MAKCSRCKKEMCDPNTKTCETYKVVSFSDGTKMSPIPFTPLEPEVRCHDCGVAAGGFHHVGCDMEICPRCGGQFLGCSCFLNTASTKNTAIKTTLTRDQFNELLTFLKIIKQDFNDFCIVNGQFRSRTNNGAYVVETNFTYFDNMDFIIADITNLVEILSVLNKTTIITVAVNNREVCFTDGHQNLKFNNYTPHFCDNKFFPINALNEILFNNIDHNRPIIEEILPQTVVININKISRHTKADAITFKHTEGNLNEGNIVINNPVGSKNIMTQGYTIKLKNRLLTPMDKDHYFNITSFPFEFVKSDMVLNYNFLLDQNILSIIHKTKVNELSINIYGRAPYLNSNED